MTNENDTKEPMTQPRVGISACLLGKKVRHNGEAKRNDWLVDHLGKFVTWVGICPEVEMGLGIPRDTLRLIGTAEKPEMIVVRTQENLTDLAQKTARTLLSKDLDLDCYVFKKDSPSCGLERVKIYGKSGIPDKKGVGLFAAEVKNRYPFLPMIEEGRLCDAQQRENFVIRIFAWHRLKSLNAKISEIQKFHELNKLLLLSISPPHYQRLGQICANPKKMKPSEVLEEYRRVFFEAFQNSQSTRKRVNVLQHMAGYFKVTVERDDRKQLTDLIEDYRLGQVPLAAPLALLQYLTKKHSVTYLQGQTFFQPFPKALHL